MYQTELFTGIPTVTIFLGISEGVKCIVLLLCSEYHNGSTTPFYKIRMPCVLFSSGVSWNSWRHPRTGKRSNHNLCKETHQCIFQNSLTYFIVNHLVSVDSINSVKHTSIPCTHLHLRFGGLDLALSWWLKV